jgi:4-diphosphocytidyl-2-C-methyl-D-erythritol kinase
MFLQRIPFADSAESAGLTRSNSSPRIVVWAPAKLNLYLEILNKRVDNYHELQTLMVAINLYDVLSFEPNDLGKVHLSCDVADLPVSADNLVYKAANLLRMRTGCTLGATIHLSKRIPWAAGLGGGSSDAAATLVGLNELWQLNLSNQELAGLAGEIGSDISFFFYTPIAWCTGRGEIVSPMVLGKPLHLVLVAPEAGLSTAEVFRELKWETQKSEVRSQKSEIRDQRTKPDLDMVSAFVEGDVNQIARYLHNRLQEPAMRLSSSVREWYRRLQNTNAAGCLMSGSGSSLFALCRDHREALQVIQELQRGSPLDEANKARIYLVQSCP